MRNLRMELNAIERFALMFYGCVRTAIRSCKRLKIIPQLINLIAMTHPHSSSLRQIHHQIRMIRYRKICPAILSTLSRMNITTQYLAPDLHTVANTKHRHAEFQYLLIARRCIFRINTRRPARKDHAFKLQLTQLLSSYRRLKYLRINIMLTHTPRDQLTVLTAKIDYCNYFP